MNKVMSFPNPILSSLICHRCLFVIDLAHCTHSMDGSLAKTTIDIFLSGNI